MTVQELLTESLEDIGVTQIGGTPTTAQLAKGERRYNTLLKNLRGRAIDTWARDTITLVLTADKLTYTVGTGLEFNVARPLDTIAAYRTDGTTDTPITMYSKKEYFMLSSKSETGTPTQFYYDQEYPTANLFIWPVPSATELPLSLVFDVHTAFVDQELADTVSIPEAWEEAMINNLQLTLSKAFGRPVTPEMKSSAKESLDNALGLDKEQAPMRFIPNWQLGNK